MACTTKVSSVNTAGPRASSTVSSLPSRAVSIPSTLVSPAPADITSPTSIPSPQQDWPSTSVAAVACSRRVSWQGDFLSTSWKESCALSSPYFAGSSKPFDNTASSRSSSYSTFAGNRQGNSADTPHCRPVFPATAGSPSPSSSIKSPKVVHSTRPGLIFTSPFSDASYSTKLASNPSRVCADSGSIPSLDSRSDILVGTPTTPGASSSSLFSPISSATSISSVDSPSLLTPAHSSWHEPSSRYLTPFEVAFSQQQQPQAPKPTPTPHYNGSTPLCLEKPFYFPSSGNTAGQQDRSISLFPQSPLSPMSRLSPSLQPSMYGQTPQYSPYAHGPMSPMAANSSIPVSPRTRPQLLALEAEASASSKRDRRRSVDVGMLVNAREQGRNQAAQASTMAFAHNEQRRDERIRKSHNPTGKDSLFAQHLTSILAHSLSLCSINADPDVYLETDAQPGLAAVSARSSISSTHSSNGPLLDTHVHRVSSRSSLMSMNSPPLVDRRRSAQPWTSTVTPERREQLIQDMSQWGFNGLAYTQDELIECACIVFECVLQMQGIDKNIDWTRLRSFLVALRSAYHSRNAYHNFAHAVDVTQACYSFLVRLGLSPPLETLLDGPGAFAWMRDAAIDEEGCLGSIIRPMDVFALLIAAIGHDVGHPGLSNAYMVNARTPAAQVYNDKSVLENFHSATLARMLKLYGFGWLLDTDQGVTPFRQVMLASVLATDMSRHFPIVVQLTELGQRLSLTNGLSKRKDEDRLLICSGLMKCADISNPTRPHLVARQWSTALLEEWAVQAQIEAHFKLPISVVLLDPMERVAQAKSQVGFINLFTQPLFGAMASVAAPFKQFANYACENKLVWERIVADGENAPLPNAPDQAVNIVVLPVTRPQSPQSTPKMPSRSSFDQDSTNVQQLPASRGFSSRLSANRVAEIGSIDAVRANSSRSEGDLTGPPSASSSSSASSMFSPSISTSERNDSISSVATTASWAQPSSVDDCLELGDEECQNNCGSVTAACSACSRRLKQDRAEITYFGSPVQSSVWPPDPFRPPIEAE